MAKLLTATVLAVVLAACDTGQPSPSVKAWPTGGPLAVYAGRSGNQGVVSVVSVVGFTGGSAKVLATATVAARTGLVAPAAACPAVNCGQPNDPPSVSTSADRIYVLDGDATVKVLAPDGSLTKVTSIPGRAGVFGVFAVSPDDSRIAVGVIDTTSGKFSLYVENLRGGGRVDVFGGAALFYWPVGWHSGKIVLASLQKGATYLLNQYGASGYALIDPTAGAQPMALGKGDCVPSGTLNGGGTACVAPGPQCLEGLVANATSPYYYNSCLRRVSWSGSETNFLLPSNAYTSSFTVGNAALSPDGQVIMTDQLGRVLSPISDTHGGNVFLPASATNGQANLRMGWISNELFSTTVVGTDGTTTQSIVALNPPDYNATRDVSFAGAAPTVGSLVGTLPGGL